MIPQNKLSSFWNKYSSLIILVLLLGIYLATSSFIALNLKPGIIPDEPAHFTFSKHFASTAGIPPDTIETYSWGWYIRQNPFLYWWINGRVINLITLVNPFLSDWGLLIALRFINIFYVLGTLLFCYFMAGEIINNKWWQLLPVFLLTNTLMFVFLSSGVNYDNLANLFSMAGLFFLVRVFKQRNYLINSIAWMILVGLGALTKYTILPLVLAMTISWLIYTIIHRKKIFPIKIDSIKTIVLLTILSGLLIGNFAIYGQNIINYQSLTPPCRAILTEDQCAISPYILRQQETALKDPLTVEESISKGYPSPVVYPFKVWIPNMLLRSFGAIGHRAYYPLALTIFFQGIFYWMIFLGILNFMLWKKASFTIWSLIGITTFYAFILLVRNYSSELIYGFQHISQAGRYLFPVIGGIYILFSKVLQKTPIKPIKWITLALSLILFFYSGPFSFIRGFNSIFMGWFIN